MHPVLGAYHLSAMIGAGMVSVILGGRNIWLVPSAFIVAMLAGGTTGMLGFAVPVAEVGMAIILLFLGLAIAIIQKGFLDRLTFGFVFCFGICQGNEYGLEIPKLITPFFYTIGFLFTSIFIHVVGIFLGEIISDNKYSKATLPIMRGLQLQ